MRTITDNKSALALLAGLSLVGALAGCSTSPSSANNDSGNDTTESDDSTTDDSATAEGAYADGTYDASGTYQSPAGTETVDVTITLADDVITAVEVAGHGETPNSIRFQGEFADGIGAIVVGKDIDDIAVTKVAGSSLTSGGFNAAVEEIKAEAAA